MEDTTIAFAKFYQKRIEEKMSFASDFFEELENGKADIETTSDEIQALFSQLLLDWVEVEEGSQTLERLMNA